MTRGEGRVRLLPVMRRAVRLVWRSSPRDFVLAMVLEVVVAAALGVTLLAGREVVADLTATEAPTLGEVVPSVIVLGAALMISGIAQVAVREMRALMSEQTTRTTQEEIVDIATSVDYERFESAEFHDLLQRANSQALQASYQIVAGLLGLLNMIGTSLAVVYVLATTVPEVLIGLALVGVPFAIAARVSAQLGFRVTYELTTADRLRNYLYRAQTDKPTAKELRAFALADSLRKRWSAIYHDRIQRLRGLARKRLVYNGIASLASSALVAAVLLVLVNGAIGGQITLADAAVAIVALQQLAVRIRTATNAAGGLRSSALFLDDFDAFRDMKGEADIMLASSALPAGILEVKDLTFRYPDTKPLVLRDISFNIAPGEVVALVGASGSGKTTLANVVAGLYRPTSGSVRYGGQDIEELDMNEYRRSLAVVFQDYERYEMSAIDNITVGDDHRADDRQGARTAARHAGIDGAISALGHGYDTMLSRSYEEGAELSVGQWQRIAIARAFFRDAPLLILDEPAAALDALAEQDLVEHLGSLMSDRSVLMISHRFSTVRLADRILVMADGRIVEHGTHAELISLGGRYAELFHLQAKGYLPDLPQGTTGTQPTAES